MFEEPIHPLQSGFSHGEISPEITGRVDLQAYASALRTSRNAFIRTEGSWTNRPGTEFCANSVTDVPKGSILIPFTFNVGQSYILELGAGTLQVFDHGALLYAVTDPTPYSVSDLVTIRYAQSADTLTIVHHDHPPYEFKRVTDKATQLVTFTFLPVTFTTGPFQQENIDATSFVYASAISGLVTLTASTHIFNAKHVGGLIKLAEQDLSPVRPWEPITRLNAHVDYIAGIVGIRCRSNLKNYVCVGYPGYDLTVNNAQAIDTGTVAPDHDRGTQPDGSGYPIPNGPNASGVLWQYTDSGFGIVKITAFISPTQVQGVVQSNYDGGPGLLPVNVVGGPVEQVIGGVTYGPWTFTGDGATTVFDLTAVFSLDPSRYLVQLDTGSGPLYAKAETFALVGHTIVFNDPPEIATIITVQEVSAYNMTSYWSLGAFSDDQGYPGAVTYYPDRLVYAATKSQPVGVFASETSDYHDFRVSNPVVASDAFTVYLNARQLNAISDLVPLQDLIVDTANITWRLWPGPTGAALSPLAIEATPQAFLGSSPNCAAVLYGDSMIYVVYGGRRIRDLVYQFQFDKYVGAELTAYSRHLVPFGTEIVEMQYKAEPFGLIYALRSDGILLCCTYVRDQQMIAWCRWDTQGLIDDIAVVPEDGSYTLYQVVQRVINGTTQRFVERLAQTEVTSYLDYQFMDSNLTYDGRNTSPTTMTLSLVAGNTSWAAGQLGVITASSAVGWVNFVASDVAHKNQIQLFDANGYLARVLIVAYLTPTTAQVRMVDPIPATLQGTSTATWTFARTTFGGIDHLKGQTVTVLADGNYMGGAKGMPNIVVNQLGFVTLQYAAGVVCVGLQYFSDLETLPLNAAGQETIRERAKGLPHAYLDVTGTRGVLVGSDFTNMSPIPQRAFEPYLSPTAQQEGIINALVLTEFGSECHLCVRQPYPLPVTIRMVIPSVNVGDPVG